MTRGIAPGRAKIVKSAWVADPAPALATCYPVDSPASQLRTDLTAIRADGAFYSVMVGVGETYLPAFALAMGIGEVASGLIATIPMLLGGVLQLVSPWAIRLLRSHQRWVVLCAGTQAASFLPLMAAALSGNLDLLAAFALATLYWASGLATMAAWNTWVGALIPERIHAKFFARRTRLMQTAVLAGFLIGGLALQAGSAVGQPRFAFAILFLIAGTCRFISMAFLASQSEPFEDQVASRNVPVRELLGRVRGTRQGRWLVYMLLVPISVQIAGPFFNPFMLGQLKFSYATFMLITATAYLAKIVSLPLWGMVARRHGAERLLWIGGVGLIPLSAAWLITQDVRYLLLVQVAGGFAWAAYELAVSLLFIVSIHPAERTSVLTRFYFAHAAATAAGSLLGGGLLRLFGEHVSGYFLLFVLSSLARLAAFAYLVWPTGTSRSARPPRRRGARATVPENRGSLAAA